MTEGEGDFRPVDNSKVLREFRQLRDRVARIEEHLRNKAATPSDVVTRTELKGVMDKLATHMNDEFEGAKQFIDEHRREIDSLHLRVNSLGVDLDEFRAFQYCGVYKAGKIYQRNQFATWNGALWHCNRKTEDAPGKSACWQLAVKGADAR